MGGSAGGEGGRGGGAVVGVLWWDWNRSALFNFGQSWGLFWMALRRKECGQSRVRKLEVLSWLR